jgi:hypothetical protein
MTNTRPRGLRIWYSTDIGEVSARANKGQVSGTAAHEVSTDTRSMLKSLPEPTRVKVPEQLLMRSVQTIS